MWLLSPLAFALMFFVLLCVSVAHPDTQTRRYWTGVVRLQWILWLRVLLGGRYEG